MIREIGQAAWRLDAWLHANIGRPYNTILGVGLVISITANLQSVGQAIGSNQQLVKIAAMVVFQLILLVNQLGQLHERREARRTRRRAKD